MKRRKSALAAAGALLAVFAIAGPVGASNPTNGSNPYHYGGEYYGSEQNNTQAIPEPGKTNKTPNGAPWSYYFAGNPNNLPGHP